MCQRLSGPPLFSFSKEGKLFVKSLPAFAGKWCCESISTLTNLICLLVHTGYCVPIEKHPIIWQHHTHTAIMIKRFSLLDYLFLANLQVTWWWSEHLHRTHYIKCHHTHDEHQALPFEICWRAFIKIALLGCSRRALGELFEIYSIALPMVGEQ